MVLADELALVRQRLESRGKANLFDEAPQPADQMKLINLIKVRMTMLCDVIFFEVFESHIICVHVFL